MAGETIEGLKFTKPENRKACAVALNDSIVERFDFLKVTEAMSAPAVAYRPQHPQFSDYYWRIEDHFEVFV